ncbi:hypothetical protein BZA77DRAFT_223457, partial [Pyronema omphalodes]
MLGRLFNSATSTAATSPNGTRPSTSHAEGDEIHTRNLLYPDSSSSVSSSFHSSYSLGQQSQSSVATSVSLGDIDLDPLRDVRVVIAQDATSLEQKLVLFDSKPPLGTSPSFEEGPTSPNLGGGTYGRSRRRNQQYPPHAPGTDDELRIFTDCMFGVAPLSYKGPSTKVHTLPSIEDRRSSLTNTSPTTSRRGSLGFELRPPTNRQQESVKQQPQPHTSQPAKEKRQSVMITRLFSVVIPPCPTPAVIDGGRNINIPQPAGSGEHTATPTSSVGSTSGFPFPKFGGGQTAPSITPKHIRPSKVSMYAIGLIISLPPSASPSTVTFPTRCCYHKPFLTYDSEFPHRHEFCCPTPPSYDEEYSTIASGSIKGDCAAEDLHTTAAVNDWRMDLVATHWDVILRALSDLQQVAQARILENLTSARLVSPQPMVSTQMNGRKYLNDRCELRKMGLMRDDIVRSEVERLRWRVVSGIRTPRVVVGQGRWDRWREEAKWANHRFGGRDTHFFFLTLLTAFLGHHTEWLDALGPEPYKRRHKQQLKARSNPEESAIRYRTVLLSNDRIAARRLIYLLSTFLPAKAQQTLDALHPSSRTSSINYLSQSPPNFSAAGTRSAPGSQYGSLRRKARKKPSKLNVAVSSETEADDTEDLSDWPIAESSSNPTSNNGSALQLPLAPGMRKSESTGTLTTLPSSATCVASAGARNRPNSSGSAASINLLSTLKRNNTSDSTWSSILTFWSAPKSTISTAASSEVADLGDFDEPILPPPFSPILSAGDYPRMEQLSIDDVDGALNVPLDLTSPLSSPPQWTMPNIHAHLDPDPLTTHVAGWNDEHFHPDFLVQSVKPYPEVERDIKRAMRMEPTPNNRYDSTSEDRWVIVSECLVADARSHKIKRITLRRRAIVPAVT